MSDLVLEMRPCVKQAIGLMEWFHKRHHGELGIPFCRKPGPWLEEVEELEADVMALYYSPERAVTMDEADAVWNLAVFRRFPVAWAIRTRRPLAVVLLAIVEWAGLEVRQLVNEGLREWDFTPVTEVCASVAPTPIKVCDARSPESFLKSLPLLFPEAEASYVVCDWELEGEELLAARQLSLESGMKFLSRKGPGLR